MTKSQIKAELRRSACEDKSPYFECTIPHFEWHEVFDEYRILPKEGLNKLSVDNCRTFFLLVAEAL